MDDALLCLPLRSQPGARAVSMTRSIFSDYQSLKAVWNQFVECKVIPAMGETVEKVHGLEMDHLRGVCTGLLISQMCPILDAAIQTAEFRKCLPNEAKLRPLQVSADVVPML